MKTILLTILLSTQLQSVLASPNTPLVKVTSLYQCYLLVKNEPISLPKYEATTQFGDLVINLNKEDRNHRRLPVKRKFKIDSVGQSGEIFISDMTVNTVCDRSGWFGIHGTCSRNPGVTAADIKRASYGNVTVHCELSAKDA